MAAKQTSPSGPLLDWGRGSGLPSRVGRNRMRDGWFRGRLVFKAQRLLYSSTTVLRGIKKIKKDRRRERTGTQNVDAEGRDRIEGVIHNAQALCRGVCVCVCGRERECV